MGINQNHGHGLLHGLLHRLFHGLLFRGSLRLWRGSAGSWIVRPELTGALLDEIGTAQHAALLIVGSKHEFHRTVREWLSQPLSDFLQESFLGEIGHEEHPAAQDNGVRVQDIGLRRNGHGQVLNVFQQQRVRLMLGEDAFNAGSGDHGHQFGEPLARAQQLGAAGIAAAAGSRYARERDMSQFAGGSVGALVAPPLNIDGVAQSGAVVEAENRLVPVRVQLHLVDVVVEQEVDIPVNVDRKVQLLGQQVAQIQLVEHGQVGRRVHIGFILADNGRQSDGDVLHLTVQAVGPDVAADHFHQLFHRAFGDEPDGALFKMMQLILVVDGADPEVRAADVDADDICQGASPLPYISTPVFSLKVAAILSQARSTS